MLFLVIQNSLMEQNLKNQLSSVNRGSKTGTKHLKGKCTKVYSYLQLKIDRYMYTF